jgi:stage III sporulation protein AE
MDIKSKCLLVFVLCLIFMACPVYASAAETDAEAIAADLDFSGVESFINSLNNDLVDDFNLQNIWQDAKNGRLDLSWQKIFNALWHRLWHEVTESAALLVQLVVLAVASLLLVNFQEMFPKSSIAIIARAVVYLVLMTIALQSFLLVGDMVKNTVDNMSGFVYALLPTLLTLMVAMGGVSSVGIFHPALLGAIGINVNIIKVAVVPLAYFSAALVVVSYITPKFDLSKMAKLCQNMAVGIITLMLTLFTAFLGILGLTGAAIDGLTIKAAKSATGLFVPLVGKPLADAFDTVLSTALLIKNSVGVVGILVILIICALPIIKILVIAVIYRLAAALVQPLGDGALAEALHGLSNSLLVFFAVVAGLGLFFFFMLSITVGISDISMMMR